MVDLDKAGYKGWKCLECGQIVYSSSKEPLTFTWKNGHTCQFQQVFEVAESIHQDTVTIERLTDMLVPIQRIQDKVTRLLFDLAKHNITDDEFRQEAFSLLKEIQKNDKW